MDLDFKIVNNDICVKLVGEIDEYTARTGFGLVIGRYKKLRAKRAELLLKNVPPQVDKVFRTSGLYSFVPVVK